MKTLILFLLICVNIFSQTKIDYENFDENLAKKAFINAFTIFRDTFTTHHLTLNYAKVDSMSPEMNKKPQLRKMRWSDWLYDNLSKQNCQKIINMGDRFDHVDVTSWLELNRSNISVIGAGDIKGLTSPNRLNFMYKENIFQSTYNFQTYEELVSYIIKSWDKSPRHSAIMRGKHYSTVKYEKNNIILTSIFSCSIKYDKKNNRTKSTINIIDFI
jgi:hypothetical protein